MTKWPIQKQTLTYIKKKLLCMYILACLLYFIYQNYLSECYIIALIPVYNCVLIQALPRLPRHTCYFVKQKPLVRERIYSIFYTMPIFLQFLFWWTNNHKWHLMLLSLIFVVSLAEIEIVCVYQTSSTIHVYPEQN